MYASRLLPRVTRHCKASHPFHTRGCCHFRVPSITAATKCYLAPSHPASEEAVKDWRQVSPGNSRTTIRFVVVDLVLTSRIFPARPAAVSCFHSSHVVPSEDSKAGKNTYIRDQILPTSQKDSEDLFRHAQHPRTVSIIG